MFCCRNVRRGAIQRLKKHLVLIGVVVHPEVKNTHQQKPLIVLNAAVWILSIYFSWLEISMWCNPEGPSDKKDEKKTKQNIKYAYTRLIVTPACDI